MGKKESVEKLMDKYAAKVISKLGDTFDSHDFIEGVLKDREAEKEYVEVLYEFRAASNGIFREFHSLMATYLSDNQTSLKIEKKERGLSDNIKGYESGARQWKKN